MVLNVSHTILSFISGLICTKKILSPLCSFFSSTQYGLYLGQTFQGRFDNSNYFLCFNCQKLVTSDFWRGDGFLNGLKNFKDTRAS